MSNINHLPFIRQFSNLNCLINQFYILSMKKIFIALLLLPTLLANAQKSSDFEVGFNLYVFEFLRKDNGALYKGGKQNIPNGYSIGLTLEKNWNEKWGIKAGFDYSTQNEIHYLQQIGSEKIQTKYNYYKLPLSIQFFHKLNPKMYLAINQGMQISLLGYFETVSTSNISDVITTITPTYAESKSNTHPEWNYFSYEDRSSSHRKMLLGIVGSAGIKGILSNKLSYSANIRYEYDITSDKNTYAYSSIYGGLISSHNFRIGVELGLQYKIPKSKKSKAKCVEF